MTALKTNVDGYVKNQSNIIINTKKDEHLTYKKEIEKVKKIKTLENEVSMVKNELLEIRKLLTQLVEKNNV